MVDFQGKDTNLNGKRSAVPHQDVINEMEPKTAEPSPVETGRWRDLLELARVRPTDSIDEDVACLTIQQDGKDFVIGTLGNISTWAGKAKAKKTTVVSFVIAAAVALKLVLDRIKGALPKGKETVLLFDTEQSQFHVLKVIKRICRLCDISDPPNLLVYSLRPYTPQDRLKAIDFALNNTPNVGLVVIDGVRDLATDPVLDAEQASQIMTHLLQWTDHLKIHIMCVLHMNKADTNLRGHLGTELVNKSETVISVTRDANDKEISKVEAEYCRNLEFDPFYFRIDETGLPCLVEDDMFSSERIGQPGRSGIRKTDLSTADSITPETVSAILKRAFTEQEALAYGQLKTNIIEASQYVGMTLSESRARSFIQRVVLERKLVAFRPEKARWDFYKINTDVFTQSG